MQARRREGQTGFTVVEVLIVIIVIAILAVITVVSYRGISDRAHASATATNVLAYINALETMELHEGTIYKGSGCVGGKSTDSCWLAVYYRGDGCSAYFGGEVPADLETSPRNADFDAKIASYLGSIPEKVQTNPFVYTMQLAEGCVASITIDGATYDSYMKITVKANGDITFTSNANRATDDAWAIMYRLPGANSQCNVTGSIRAKPDALVQAAGGNYTTCYILHGDVVYE